MALALFGAAYLALVAIATLRPSPYLWGTHFPAFLSFPAQVATVGLMALGVALVTATALPTERSGRNRRESPSRGLPRWLPWLGLAAWGAALWTLRTKSFLLGDQALWITRLEEGTEVVYSEPLSAIAWRGFRWLLLRAGAPIEPESLAILPVLCGLVAAPLCLQIGREAAGPSRAGWFAALALLAGASQVYFGYVEVYALVGVALLAYFWLALRFVHGRSSAVLPGIALGVAVSSHLASAVFVPSYLFLVFRRPISRVQRATALATTLAVVVGIFTVAAFGYRELLHPVRLIWEALWMSGGARADLPAALLAPLRVLSDLGNWLLLSAAVPIMLLAASVASGRKARQPAEPALAFLAVAGVSGLLLAATLCVPGTPAQDWDLLTIGAIPIVLLGAAAGGRLLDRRENRGMGAGLALLSAGGLLGFALTNADPAAAVRRFETLMSDDATLSAHERAYGNEKLADYYSERGNGERAVRFARRALAADSANARYWGKVGQALYQLGRYSEAAPYFAAAVERGAPPGPSYYYLGYAELQMGRPREAVPLLWKAVRAEPNRSVYWSALGLALVSSGDAERGRAIWERTLARWPDDRETRAAYRMVFGGEPAPGAAADAPPPPDTR
jgi:tetratricopeptide (TPR) repeat protein